jgi:hypothetical protein
VDRTTKKNIIWATNDYLNLGYEANKPILSELITGGNTKVIQPRISKDKEQQGNRTRIKAEVFTHSWICNKQNNLIDEQWFGRKNVFNSELECSWLVNNEKIEFTNENNRTWQNYVDAKRMEISCGEAPYLVSRYDTVTGELIHIQSRIGLLDRKMRVVNENTYNEDEWFKWTVRTFQSVYGYEFQGDNLLLARQNLLYTFIDNMRFKFTHEPSETQLKEIATIISWNLWQMDGVTSTLPFSDTTKILLHGPLFNLDEASKTKYCKIKDWRSKKIVEYVSLVKGG